VAAPRAPLNSRYRVLYPTQFLRAGSPLHRILAEERPDLVEICDKYSLNYLGTVLRLGLLEGLDFKPWWWDRAASGWTTTLAPTLRRPGWGGRFIVLYALAVFSVFRSHIANSSYTAEELIPASQGAFDTAWRVGAAAGRGRGTFLSRAAERKYAPEVTATMWRRPGYRVAALRWPFVPEKNLPLLVDIARELAAVPDRDYRMLIAGEGMGLEALQKLARQQGQDRVTFLGHVGDREALASLYSNCDVFVHPNPREPSESRPWRQWHRDCLWWRQIKAECFRMRAPRMPGWRSRRRKAFSAAISSAVTPGTMRQAKLQAALATAGTFRWENVTDSLLRLYRDLHGAAQGAPLTETTRVSSRPNGSPAGGNVVRVVSGTAKRLFGAAARWNFVPPPAGSNHDSR